MATWLLTIRSCTGPRQSDPTAPAQWHFCVTSSVVPSSGSFQQGGTKRRNRSYKALETTAGFSFPLLPLFPGPLGSSFPIYGTGQGLTCQSPLWVSPGRKVSLPPCVFCTVSGSFLYTVLHCKFLGAWFSILWLLASGEVP